MSDNDSFISEVSEEVRRDRMFALWKRFGPLVIGAVVAVVAAAGVKTYLDHQADVSARSAGGALLAAADGTPAQAAEALTALADQTDHEGAATLARLRAASALAEAGDVGAAASAYDVVAGDAGADALLQDFASFRALMLRADGMAPDALADSLAPFISGGPFRLLALEAQGLAFHRAGDETSAAAALKEVAEDEATPPGLRQRVLAVMTALGIEADLTGAEDNS